MRKYGLVAAAALALMGGTAFAKTTIIYAGHVITDPDKPVRGASTITVTDDRITAIGEGRTPAPAGAEIVDLGDKTLLPGLIDLHVHLTGDPGGDYRSEAVDPDEWGVVVGVKNAGITLRAASPARNSRTSSSRSAKYDSGSPKSKRFAVGFSSSTS